MDIPINGAMNTVERYSNRLLLDNKAKSQVQIQYK